MQSFASPDQIRSWFSSAMSEMYRREVPQYGTLLSLVAEINQAVLDRPDQEGLFDAEERQRLGVERHGAIRVGTAAELAGIAQIFKVMGMHPVGYYDLSVAGVPVHSTAFRPIGDEALKINPFRVFTSLLRLELIPDRALRERAEAILSRRQIFTPTALELLTRHEQQGGLSVDDAEIFVREALETFRWHGEATVDGATYRELHDAHRLIADVVSFKGPHINHLTTRTLDIDAAQEAMPRCGIEAKASIEGPPHRRHSILLRQTSFTALSEPIRFVGDIDAGTHTARFGEIEQRGMALTREGRALYDRLLDEARRDATPGSSSAGRLASVFQAFPDDLRTLRHRGLAFFRYEVKDAARFKAMAESGLSWDLEVLVEAGAVAACPLIYEDFLPVSAAGIFRSNLGGAEPKAYDARGAKAGFEAALGMPVHDEIALYEQARDASVAVLKRAYAQEQYA